MECREFKCGSAERDGFEAILIEQLHLPQLGAQMLARSGNPPSEAELCDKGLKMAWLTQVAHLGMTQLLAAKVIPEAEVCLSIREVAVLRWTAEGKTSAEISDIFNISDRTVNFHIGNTIAKLNATNKTAAVIRALLLGMLY